MKDPKGYVYVLQLGDGCEYVGMTQDITHRLSRHKKSDTVEWVNRHGFVDIKDIIPTDSPKELERKVTLWRMEKAGWENVRGYAWTKSDLKNPPKALR